MASELPADLAAFRKVSVRVAAELNDMSVDTFRRRHSDLILNISPRRQAVRLGDALAIGEPKKAAASSAA
jgi:hypothetical protein